MVHAILQTEVLFPENCSYDTERKFRKALYATVLKSCPCQKAISEVFLLLKACNVVLPFERSAHEPLCAGPSSSSIFWI